MRLRVSWAGVFFAAIMLLPQLASADDTCVCLYGHEETPWSAMFAAMEEAKEHGTSLDLLETPGPELPRTILWCISADDPRCSQRHPGNEAPSGAALRSTPVGVLVTSIPVARSAGTRVVWPTELGQARDGVRTRLERPPQS